MYIESLPAGLNNTYASYTTRHENMISSTRHFHRSRSASDNLKYFTSVDFSLYVLYFCSRILGARSTCVPTCRCIRHIIIQGVIRYIDIVYKHNRYHTRCECSFPVEDESNNPFSECVGVTAVRRVWGPGRNSYNPRQYFYNCPV